ncbi:MAG: type II secretion system minor pseudopilin GspH [Thiohalobacteraceae bacterium]
MTISATGTFSNRPRRIPAGFTLLEMLVVVAIIGIVLTFAVLAIGGDRRAEELERESRLFAELLRMAGEQAVLRGEEWAVQLDPEGYRFLLYTDEGWRTLEGDELFRPRELAEDTWLRVELEGRDLDLEKTRDIKPTLLLLSSGETSPFVAEFSADDTERRFLVQTDDRLQIEWQDGDQ